jgi:hypothetical protein
MASHTGAAEDLTVRQLLRGSVGVEVTDGLPVEDVTDCDVYLLLVLGACVEDPKVGGSTAREQQ